MHKILLIFGTRPEAIKLCPVILSLREHPYKFDVRVCVTGQHREMLDQVLQAFHVKPNHDLNLMLPGADTVSIDLAHFGGPGTGAAHRTASDGDRAGRHYHHLLRRTLRHCISPQPKRAHRICATKAWHPARSTSLETSGSMPCFMCAIGWSKARCAGANGPSWTHRKS
jgi:hypothetical protein